MFATFTALAITGIADFEGSLLGRLGAVATTVAIGIGLTALGTWASTRPVGVACAVMFVVVALIVLAGLLGGYAAAGSNTLILFYVVAAGSAAPASAIPDRLEGVALGGVLALAAAVLLWPEPAHPQTLPQLGATLRSLATRLASLASDPGAQGLVAEAETTNIRAEVDALGDRPAAPTSTQRAELYLINDIERLGRLTTRLEQKSRVDRTDPLTLTQCAGDLARYAAALGGDEVGLVASAGAGPQATAASPFSLAARLAAVTAAVERHAQIALGQSPDGPIVDPFTSSPSRHSSWDDIVHGAHRARANFTLRSVHVRDALRLGAGLALAWAAVDVFGLKHGFWVVFAALTVIKSNLRATGRSVGEAIAGTFLGFLIAAAVIAGLKPATDWYLALLPVVVAAAIYANVAVSFLAGQAGFTLAIIVLFNLLGPAGWRIGAVRVMDVLAGALAGLLIGALAWPRGASAAMGNATADLLETAGAYLASTAHAFVDRALPEPSMVRRQLAGDAAVRAESTFAQYLTEHPPPDAVAGWAHWLSTANRLWYAGDMIAAAKNGRVHDAARTVDAADRLAVSFRDLAASLRGQQSPLVRADTRPEARGSSELLAWLDDLAAEAQGAESVTPDDHHGDPSMSCKPKAGPRRATR